MVEVSRGHLPSGNSGRKTQLLYHLPNSFQVLSRRKQITKEKLSNSIVYVSEAREGTRVAESARESSRAPGNHRERTGITENARETPWAHKSLRERTRAARSARKSSRAHESRRERTRVADDSLSRLVRS